MHRQYLDVASGRLSYLDHGNGSPTVFLHALGRDAEDWRPVVERMASGRRCLVFDLRGHGESTRTERYSYESLTADLVEAADALGLDRFTLIAHSVGAVIGWLYAQSQPERLSAFVSEDTGPPNREYAYPDVPAEPPEPVDYDWNVRRHIFAQLNAPDPAWWDNIEAVTCPTLVIAGEIPDAHLDEVADRLPDGRLVAIEAGHWIHEREPDRFVSVVDSFLADVTTG